MDKKIKERQLNHAVSIIGWGGKGDELYWIMRNSQSDKWGKDGYVSLIFLHIFDHFGIFKTKNHI